MDIETKHILEPEMYVFFYLIHYYIIYYYIYIGNILLLKLNMASYISRSIEIVVTQRTIYKIYT